MKPFVAGIILLNMPDITQSRQPGRPRSFDPEDALDCALEVFRRKGYDGASLSDLTRAMGINRPSMYAAFGDKEDLFRKALDRYTGRMMMYMGAAAREKTARGFIERLLQGVAQSVTDSKQAPGCLTVTGAIACGEESEPIRKELIARRGQTERFILERLKRAKKDGELPGEANPADLARYFATIVQGMAVQAASGTSCAKLRRVAKTALKAWPEFSPNH